MTLLRSWHHLTALICTQLYRNLLTCSVTHMLPWSLLHVPGSAGCLVILATSLISCCWSRAVPDQGVVAVQDGVIHSHLLVGDGAVLLKHLLTHLLLGGEEVGLVCVVA